ncbi:hypothetical protein ACM0CQ_02570 [Mycobacteroides abscessus subsp. abscessus]|uniref:hypothetical protein n=1 Tax=Mycobacteroides abscessus TaxID=36809 RepID=UPI0018776F44|nr:hypothetical protein [Mycobacteroides abscessus]
MVDPHTIATFAFAQLRRDPKFARRFPKVRNTVVCIESDLMSTVLEGQLRHHFPDGGTVACYYPEDHRFVFFPATPAPVGAEPDTSDPDTVVANDLHGQLTVGMVIAGVLPTSPIGELSTIEIEKALVVTQ